MMAPKFQRSSYIRMQFDHLDGFGGLNRQIQPVFFVRFYCSCRCSRISQSARRRLIWCTVLYNEGRFLNRQNVFHVYYQAADDYLVKHKYTEHMNIAIESGIHNFGHHSNCELAKQLSPVLLSLVNITFRASCLRLLWPWYKSHRTHYCCE